MGKANDKDAAGDVCEDCGASAAQGEAGCLNLFEEILAREFSDYRYGRIHRLTVDVYSLQHPGAYMRSGKSFAAHLTGMCAAMEYDDPPAINQTVQKWLSTNPKIDKPAQLPKQRGTLTIGHIHKASDADEHANRVREWAREVWDSWSEYHKLARSLIGEAEAEIKR